ncbi:hypothetical protein TARUN_500 [Trichoderma arundinaceum]|uniref:Enoyl reductase (ER) domain-containing protein n=1 Tax=Trichoderma arundinaceum TaxID=490622 RepID=A0A395P078_TRIAR|nr:hypothetical protein TARUN_500 [Trichoderma arundinaceum]
MIHAEAPQGGQSEYAIAMADEIAVKPLSLSHEETAALPIPALTAWEAILKQAKLAHGSKVLVTGASGAAGAMLIQVASKILNAEVVGLASSANHVMLTELGASKVIDYNDPSWHEAIDDMDAVFDTVGGETLASSWRTLKKNGIILTVADPAPKWAFGRGKPEELQRYPDVKWLHFIVSADGGTLTKVASLLDDGTLKPIPVKVFEADEAVEAWKYAAQRGRRGKAVTRFMA